jgi:autotransporter translocation and assembly factor TamB
MRRWIARALFAVALVVLLLLATVLIGVRTGPVRDLLRTRIVTALEDATGADVQVGSVDGSVLHTLVLRDVRLVDHGRPVATMPRVEVAYRLLPLLGGTLYVQRIALEQPRIVLVHTAGGWALPTPPASADGGSGMTIVVDRLTIAGGRLLVALRDASPPRRFAATALHLGASARLGDGRTHVDVGTLRFVPRGIDVPPVSAEAEATLVSRGPVRVPRLRMTTGRSTVTLSGTVERGERADLELALAPLAAADVRAVAPGSGVRADVRLRARLRGAWDALHAVAHAGLGPGGDVVARATVDAAAASPAWDGRLDLAALDPGAVVAGLPAGHLDGRVEAAGTGVDVRGPLTYRAALTDSRLAGHAIDRLAVRGHAADGVHRLHVRVAAPVGEARVGGRVTLAEPVAYRLHGDWTLARLDLLVPATWGWAVGRADIRGSGTAADARTARVRLAVTDAAVHGLPLDHAALRARLEGTTLAVRSLTARSDELALTVDASGRADVQTRAGRVRLDAGVDLGRVGAYLDRPLRGVVQANVTGNAAGGTLDGRVHATIDGPAYAGTSAASARLDATAHDVGGAGAGGEVHASAAELRVGTGAPYAARADLGWRRADGTDRVEVALDARSDDGRTQQLAATATRTAARTTATVRTLALTPPEGVPWRLASPATITLDTALATDGVVLTAGRQRVALRGRLAVRDGTSDATLTLDAVRLAPLCTLAGGPGCAGRVAATVAITGSASAPVVDGDADLTELRAGDVPLGTLHATTRYADRRVHVDATLRHPQAGALDVAGTLPVDLAWAGARADLADAPLALDVTADRLDLTVLAALAPRTVTSSAGRLTVDLHVAGTRAAPRATGTVALDDGTLALAATGIAYHDVRLRVAADGTRIVVETLHAEAGDGHLDGSGSIDLGAAPRPVDAQLRLEKFRAVQRDAYTAALSGDVGVSGTVAEPAITGRLTVDDAVVRPAALPASGPSVPRDRTIEVVGRPEPAPAPAPPAGIPIADRLRLDVRIAVERNAWIRRSDANIELGGELHVTKAPGASVRIVGEIRLLRGWYAFQGRRFTLDEGTITFTGATPPEPTFDITAVYTVRDYRISVHITGSAEKPHLELSSEPPLEQADILSVLVFGKPAHELGKGQSVALQQQALGLAAGYAIPELRTSVMNTLGLETLEVELPEGEEPGRVSAGRYVAQDVFVSLAQEFGRRAAQVVGVEYFIWRDFSVRASTSTRGDSAIDLLWHYRY